MNCIKDCVTALAAHGINGLAEPYSHVIRFHCLHFMPSDEIVLGILVSHGMLLLNGMLPGNDGLSESEKRRAVQLLREGKTAAEVLSAIRPGGTPKP